MIVSLKYSQTEVESIIDKASRSNITMYRFTRTIRSDITLARILTPSNAYSDAEAIRAYWMKSILTTIESFYKDISDEDDYSAFYEVWWRAIRCYCLTGHAHEIELPGSVVERKAILTVKEEDTL